MLKKYKTFFEYGEAETELKKSKFIGQAFYVAGEAEVQAILAGLRKKHRGANHNCYAYRLEAATIIERQSDDGEPSGTAGMPILDILRGFSVVNGLIVVTRYFGGTLLGTGGLVKAYGEAAKTAVNAAGIIEKELYAAISLFCGYTLSGKIEHELKKTGRHIDAIVYTHRVEFKVNILIDDVLNFSKEMTDISSGAVHIETNEQLYGGILEGKFVRLL